MKEWIRLDPGAQHVGRYGLHSHPDICRQVDLRLFPHTDAE